MTSGATSQQLAHQLLSTHVFDHKCSINTEHVIALMRLYRLEVPLLTPQDVAVISSMWEVAEDQSVDPSAFSYLVSFGSLYLS